MELVVGVNSYFDIKEADEIVKTRFTSTDTNRLYWESLSEEDKAVLILLTTEKIDNNKMLFKGYKQNKNQAMQFPRVNMYGDNTVTECPLKIKIGILKQAIKESVLAMKEEGALIEMGVKSFSDGSGASITFDTGNVKKNNRGVFNDIWYTYFSDYSIIS